MKTDSMKARMAGVVFGMFLGSLGSFASAADVTSSTFQSTFYKDFSLFSTYPKETDVRTPIEHIGSVGIGIDLVLPPFQMRISRIDKGSPAEAVGTLKVGQMIKSINGAPFKAITFNPEGTTDEPLRLWTGDTLLDLQSEVHRPLQALKMTVKGDHLFVEAGGFSDKNPIGWKPPLIVMKRI